MARCYYPFMVKTDYTEVPVPCGKCPECLKRRASGWSFRLQKHALMPTIYKASFITLTYDNEHVPRTLGAGFLTLDKTHIQKFFKRLRKMQPDGSPKISYYVCGEYGGKFGRPHYHGIVFNASDDHVIRAWYAPSNYDPKGRPTPIGNIKFGDVNGASIGYTLKYMCKPRTVPAHRNDDRQPEFSLMSKSLGASYLTPEMINWHKNDIENRMICAMDDGVLISMPRYYKNKIYTEEERNKIAASAAQKNLEIETKKVQENIRKFGEESYIRMVNISRENAYKKMFKNATKNRNNHGEIPYSDAGT